MARTDTTGPVVAGLDAAPTLRQGSGQAIGLLVKIFPKLSETFILEEILGLEKRGVALKLYTLAPPTDTMTHAQVARVHSPVVRVPAVGDHGAGFLRRHLRLAATRPLSYVRGLAAALVRGRDGWRDFVRAGWLARQLELDGVAHLHTHFISTPADIAALVSRMCGRPFSISAHAKDIYLSRPQDLERKLEAATFTVTCTEFNRNTLAGIAPRASVHRMYHGLDRKLFQPRAVIEAESATPPLLLSVGRLREKKGHDTLIRACELLRRRGAAFTCEIVGYGEARDALQASIDRLGIADCVKLVGPLAREQVIASYARAAVYVQPSRIAADGDRDGIPNVLLEAMAIGLPVVASRVSGIPELVVHGRNGLLVEPDHPPLLADAIERVLLQPALRKRLGAHAIASVAAAFDNDRNLDLLCDLLGVPPRADSPPLQATLNVKAAPLAVPAHRYARAKRSATRQKARPDPHRKVAYVMNGFPRLSETFIAHEIHQLERLGLALRLYSIKREREPIVHPVVDALRSPLEYLPDATSLSDTSLVSWLVRNLPAFARANARVALAHPLRYAATLASALAMGWRHREPGSLRLRKVFVKEFLQAAHIADGVLRDGNVGHLHGHFCHGVATITWFASRLSGIPFSFTAHAKDIYQADLNPGDLLERKLGAARFVATCTCANAGVLRLRHPRPDDVHAIHHGLDTRWFSPAPNRAEGSAPLILAVGRFVEKKGFEHLIQACALLDHRGVDFGCVIVGEHGDAYERIRDLIDARGLSGRVRMRGPVAQDELREIYRGARVFALPCQVTADGDRDGFPNVLAEAMAMGVPVVTTPISGIPEFIDDGVHGLLVPSGDAAALAAALQRVLVDDALHTRLAIAGRERICDRFDSSRTTVELRDLFVAQLEQCATASTRAVHA